MPKITEEELVVLPIRLFKADHEELKKLFGNGFGVNKAVRTIVRTFVTQAKARATAAIDAQEAAVKVEATVQNDVDVLLGS